MALRSFLDQHGITHRRSCPYIHQQMRSVKQQHHHIVDNGLALLQHAQLPLEFWFYTFTTVAFSYNRTTSNCINSDSLYQCQFGEPLNLIELKVFGCQIYPSLQPHKFAQRSESHVFSWLPT